MIIIIDLVSDNDLLNINLYCHYNSVYLNLYLTNEKYPPSFLVISVIKKIKYIIFAK